MVTPTDHRDRVLPVDAARATLVGRVHDPELGPCVVAVRDDEAVDLTALAPTMSDLLDSGRAPGIAREGQAGRSWRLGDLLDASLAPAQRRAAVAHMRRVPLATALDAMSAACGFSSHRWIGAVDVPTAVVVTRDDRIVAPQRQHKLAAAVPGAVVVEIDGDHGVFLADPDGFADGLLQACAAVTLPVAPPSTTAA